LTLPIEKTICLLAALLLAFTSTYGICTLHVPRYAPNEMVVAITQAALDATYPPSLPWPPVRGPKKPKLPTIIPNDFDPDRI
jgi:hypothetical protein